MCSRVEEAEVEAEYLPSPLVVQDDAFGRDISMEELDTVVEEGQSLAQLQQAVLDLHVKQLKLPKNISVRLVVLGIDSYILTYFVTLVNTRLKQIRTR